MSLAKTARCRTVNAAVFGKRGERRACYFFCQTILLKKVHNLAFAATGTAIVFVPCVSKWLSVLETNSGVVALRVLSGPNSCGAH